MTPRQLLASAGEEIDKAEHLLWNVGYLARQLGVNRNTVRRWIKAKQIDAVRLPNGYFRIPPSEMDRLIALTK